MTVAYGLFVLAFLWAPGGRVTFGKEGSLETPALRLERGENAMMCKEKIQVLEMTVRED